MLCKDLLCVSLSLVAAACLCPIKSSSIQEMISTVHNTLAGCVAAPCPHLSRVQRLPGDEGAQSLATALAQLTQLKELTVDLGESNIRAGPRCLWKGMAPGDRRPKGKRS